MVLLKETSRDWALAAVVAVLTIGANLPAEWTEVISVDRRWFLAGLISVVAVALVRYLKFALLLVVVLLAAGANLPAEVAQEFGVDPQIMLLGLIAMVVISVSNRFLKLPTGLERSNRPQSIHGASALFTAILKGRIATVQTLLKQGVNVNARTVSGKTPLMAASYKGYGDIVQMLLEHGADANHKDARGDCALQMAKRAGFSRVLQILESAGASG